MTARGIAAILRRAAVLAVLSVVAAGATVAGGAETTNKSLAAHRAIIEIKLRPAAHFDPADPVIIETSINASDDILTSHQVPESIFDWVAMGPEAILFDGQFPDEGSDLARLVGMTDCYPWGKARELPPRKAREMAFHLRDQYRIPPGWTNLWLKEDSVWISIDRRGRVVPLPQGMEWVLAAGDHASSQSETGTYEVIERLEAPVEAPDPRAQAAEKARLRRKIAETAVGGVLAVAALGFFLWRRRSGRTTGGAGPLP